MPGGCGNVHMHNMPRPCKKRLCRLYGGDRVFKPRSIPLVDLQTIRLQRGELEALRLCDLEDLEQAAAGIRMGVSRGTIFRLLQSGRRKVVSAIVENKALVIERGANDEDLPADRG
jgi:predicted DNA-binding protein (UPF0251 family)